MCSYTGSTSPWLQYLDWIFISFQIKSCTMLCWLADDRNQQLQEIVSNFEITNNLIFSVAGRMFKPDRCRLSNKIFEALMFISCNEDFKHWFISINIQSVCCSGETDGREEGRFDSPGQLNAQPGPHVAYISALVFFNYFSVGCHLFAFFGVFSVDLGFKEPFFFHHFSSFFLGVD